MTRLREVRRITNTKLYPAFLCLFSSQTSLSVLLIGKRKPDFSNCRKFIACSFSENQMQFFSSPTLSHTINIWWFYTNEKLTSTVLLSHSTSSKEKGRKCNEKKIIKSLCIEIRTGVSLTIYHYRQNRLSIRRIM